MKAYRGLSFMELMIGLGLLAFIVFSIGILIPLSQVRIKNVTDRDTAYSLADNMLENIRALGFNDIITDKTYSGERPANEGTYYQYPPPPYPSTVVTNYYPGQHNTIISRQVEYKFTVTATPAKDKSGAEIGNLKKVVVSVFWRQRNKTGDFEDCSITLSSNIIKR